MNKDKFRGKIIGSNTGRKELDWAFGDRVEELSTGKIFICDLSHFDEKTLLKDVLIEVDPSTVGRYTELHDKNGKSIYEGDILSVFRGKDNDTGRVEYDARTASYIINYGGNTCNTFLDLFIAERKDKSVSTEIIGSIHDNPELLNSQKQKLEDKAE